MKKIVTTFLVGFLLFVSCKKEAIQTPDRLIEKEKMVDIIYDLALLEGIRNQNSIALDSFKNTADEYIYKKYKIDSAQFVQSNLYYATDLKEYKKIHEQVKIRLEKTQKEAVELEKKKADLAKDKKKEISKAKKEKDSVKG